MRIAVLPFNATEGTPPQLARQFAQFAAEITRNVTGQAVDSVNYMAQMDVGGITRLALVNPSESLNEAEMIGQFFQQGDITAVVDGLLDQSESGAGTMTVRIFRDGNTTPAVEETFTYAPAGVLGALREVIGLLMTEAGGTLPQDMADDLGLFGTTDPKAFCQFIEGFDASQYIERAQGQVIAEFDPELGMKSLVAAIEADRDWEAPYLTLIQLCRLCTMYRISNGATIEKYLKQAVELEPEDARAWFALGDLYAAIGNHQGASDAFEKAARFQPDEPAIHTRLGISYLTQGMPANAERSLRKAVEMEGDDKPSMPMLAEVLGRQGRQHEVPALWKEVLDANPSNPHAHAQYGLALVNAGRQEEGLRVFDVALETLEDNTFVKRFYAPILAQSGDLDRAMDFYEDCIDVAPTDVPLLLEYAQTLQQADRAFEVPPVLKNVLAANPDLNTRAQTQAWLIELEQPKRAEAVKLASEKIEAGDFEAGLRELKPLRNWLADYWKMWAVTANAHNQLEQFPEAEEASRRLLEIFPSFEPGYGELANALAGQGRHDEAFNLMQIALSNMPNSLLIALNYAMAAKRAGHEEEARAMVRQIREVAQPDENLQKMLAQIES